MSGVFPGIPLTLSPQNETIGRLGSITIRSALELPVSRTEFHVHSENQFRGQPTRLATLPCLPLLPKGILCCCFRSQDVFRRRLVDALKASDYKLINFLLNMDGAVWEAFKNEDAAIRVCVDFSTMCDVYGLGLNMFAVLVPEIGRLYWVPPALPQYLQTDGESSMYAGLFSHIHLR
jgi:hypothetical protein